MQETEIIIDGRKLKVIVQQKSGEEGAGRYALEVHEEIDPNDPNGWVRILRAAFSGR